jgi:hypothetical protein
MLLLHEVAGINWQVMNVVHDEGEALILYDTYKVKTTIIFMCLFWSTQHLHLVMSGWILIFSLHMDMYQMLITWWLG